MAAITTMPKNLLTSSPRLLGPMHLMSNNYPELDKGTRQTRQTIIQNWIRGCPSLGIQGGQLGEPGAAAGGTQPHCPGSLVLSR